LCDRDDGDLRLGEDARVDEVACFDRVDERTDGRDGEQPSFSEN